MRLLLSCFFFNDTATTDIYTLSLHDALPISLELDTCHPQDAAQAEQCAQRFAADPAMVAVLHGDRKSTRLNSSHVEISYAVFCLKKKKLPHALFLRSLSDVLNATPNTLAPGI